MNICSCVNTFFVVEPLNPCNESIEFAARAEEAGEHKLIVWFLGTYITISKTFEIDEVISFPLNGLNEDFEYTAAVQQPTRGQLLITRGETVYNCFTFKTAFKKNIDASY